MTSDARNGRFGPWGGDDPPGQDYDLAILDFVSPGDGVYTLRVTSSVAGRYGIIVTDRVMFESEPNAQIGGPLRTLASSAVGGIDAMLDHTPARAPLKRNIEGEEVGNTAVFLVSDLSSGITGENIYVDCGVNIVGV